MSLRPRRPDDDAFIHALSKESFGRYAIRPAWAVRGMVARGGAQTVVAETNAGPVGFAVVSFHRRRRPFGPVSAPVIANLDAIAVSQSQRGRGIGRQLLARSLDIAGEQSALSMFLTTAVANARARALFEWGGFQVAAIPPAIYRKRERGMVMLKLLA